MEEIFSRYIVNESTMILYPAFQPDYNTIVMETDRVLFIKKYPLEIIKESCLAYCSSFDGRRAAVMYQVGFQRKVPIPISIRKGIFAFPTKSPSHFSCAWIFFNHVSSINLSVNKMSKTLITFKNGKNIELNESHYILEKQMQRTAMCMMRFSNPCFSL